MLGPAGRVAAEAAPFCGEDTASEVLAPSWLTKGETNSSSYPNSLRHHASLISTVP